MLIFRLNKVFWIEILIFRFENNNLEFKYQCLYQIFFNLKKNSRIEMSIFRFKYQYLKLKCPFLDSINKFHIGSTNFENPK
jgi:hypothetical protein